MKKLISLFLILTICFSFILQIGATEITNPESVDIPVVANVKAAKLSFTVPTCLPIDVDEYGNVTVATDTKIINNSTGPIRVENVQVASQNGWELIAFETDKSSFKIDEKKIGLQINSDSETTQANDNFVFDKTKWQILSGNGNADNLDEYIISYDAIVSPQSEDVTGAIAANIVFTIGWDKAKYDTVFANNSWAEIATACQNDEVPSSWAVGDTKEMAIDGQSYSVAIIGKNHDSYADGSGTAPLTFQVVDLVGTHNMNNDNTNSGGWTGSAMYNYLNDELINKLEADVKNNIKAVTKHTNLGGADTSNNAATTEASADKLFLLSNVEITGDDFWNWYNDEYVPWMIAENIIVASEVEAYAKIAPVMKAEGDQYAYYIADGSVITPPTAEEWKSSYNYNYWYSMEVATLSGLDGIATIWWLRTPDSDNNADFHYISTSGLCGDSINNASAAHGISFAFCF